MRIFCFIIHGIFIWLLACITAEGSDLDCKEDCSCCVDGVCGPGPYFPDTCSLGCIDGYKGQRCYEKCPQTNCKQCDQITGHCILCDNGYYLGTSGDCTSKCLPECKTCTSGSACTTCKEEFYDDNGSNDCRYRYCPEKCKCKNDHCVSCMEGYYDTSNSCNSLCPDNCITCWSSTACDSCRVGYYNGYLQYDDTILPLRNDCTYKCRDNCVRCSTYSVCSVCEPGLYGSICDKDCSTGCLSNSCEIQTGKCDCSPYFAGDKCDQCQNGKYGEICDKQCSTGCKGHVCEKESGDCINGCILETIVGDNCDVCLTGLYGSSCNLSCSFGCKNNQCNRADGECADRCLNNNFKGRQCNMCINGKYGVLCNIDCPNNCDRKGCLKESGNCIRCVESFDGEKCDGCVIGLYGSACSENCSPYCLNKECDRDSGTCSYGCVDKYSGDRCCINNEKCISCLTESICKQCKSGFFTDQCVEPCHQNCIHSCDIKTGICDDCKSNFYGEHCQLSCTSTCRYQTNASENRCHRTDGTCRHGCAKGFHGFWCSKTCSIYCIDNICNQGDGKCIKGCKPNVMDNPICSLDPGPGSLEQQINTAAVVLGTILAVSLAGYVIMMVILILRKCRQRKSAGRPIYVNTDVELKCGTERNEKDSLSDTHASSSKDMAKSRDYEDLSGMQVTEHEYGDIRISA